MYSNTSGDAPCSMGRGCAAAADGVEVAVDWMMRPGQWSDGWRGSCCVNDLGCSLAETLACLCVGIGRRGRERTCRLGGRLGVRSGIEAPRLPPLWGALPERFGCAVRRVRPQFGPHSARCRRLWQCGLVTRGRANRGGVKPRRLGCAALLEVSSEACASEFNCRPGAAADWGRGPPGRVGVHGAGDICHLLRLWHYLAVSSIWSAHVLVS
jgi:hypothetical protein